MTYLGCDCGSAEWLNSEAMAASEPMSERAAGNEAPIAAALGAMIAYDGVVRVGPGDSAGDPAMSTDVRPV